MTQDAVAVELDIKDVVRSIDDEYVAAEFADEKYWANRESCGLWAAVVDAKELTSPNSFEELVNKALDNTVEINVTDVVMLAASEALAKAQEYIFASAAVSVEKEAVATVEAEIVVETVLRAVNTDEAET